MSVVAEPVALLKQYRIATLSVITARVFGYEATRAIREARYHLHGVAYIPSSRPKSDMYLSL